MKEKIREDLLSETQGNPRYRSLLLRAWTGHAEGGLTWRFSVEDTRSRVIRTFPDIASLCEYLTQFFPGIQVSKIKKEQK